MGQRNLLRREFVRFLAASPLLALDKPAEAINVMDFEPLAQKALPPAHWGYLSTGVSGDATLRANREAMDHYQLRARQLTGVVTPELKTEVFGETWDTPVYLSAVGHQRQFHPEAELATARASREQKTMQMLSTVANSSVEDVAKARGAAPWFQLYMPATWADTEKMVRRVEASGCKVLVWTIDAIPGRSTETLARLARTDSRDCLSCHNVHPMSGRVAERNRVKPMFAGLSGEMNPMSADWSYVDRLKRLTRMKVVLKGIDTAEDAALAREHGADGIVVSNHGGRATETGRGTMDILPEAIDAVKGQIPVMVDGGFRRGADIYKALAVGAAAVGIGRPYIWGLTAFGQSGVERVLEILRAELTLTMRQCGSASIKQITRASILRNGVRF
jgi:isopentenyl diphosphate isomerase/L-lactate dehydrogenase-like FMN-dependent dehydrogenase